MTTESPFRLAGKRLLVVEDEAMLAMSLQWLLETMDCEVIKAPTVARALALAKTENIDAALLDVNLRGELAWPVAAELDRRGIPFVFMTGYNVHDLAPDWRSRPVVRKPFVVGDLERAMAKVTGTKR